MVVRGQHGGQVGRVIARDNSRYVATVQLVLTDDVLNTDYDNICQYLGPVPDYE